MNLLDDFLFFKMLNHPGFGEEFSRELLKTIFGKDFGKLDVVPQKVYYGADVDKLMPFDPFGYNHMIYTIKNSCMEIPELPYEDGARTIFLYTKGKKGNVSQRLRELLEYMEDTREEKAVNESLKKIDDMVRQVKMEKGVQLEYMKIFDFLILRNM